MFALIKDGVISQYPYWLDSLRQAHPDTSFPSQPNDSSLESFGVFRVFYSTPPEITDTQAFEEGTPIFDADAKRWTQTWKIREMTPTEIAEKAVSQAAAIRAERNSLLASSDWTQLEDAPVDKSAWATYRQALRDVPAQSGFPWNVAWPAQPE